MKKNILQENYKHTTYGGYIYFSDFETTYAPKDNTHGSPIASRIYNDWKFDEKCENNIKTRERQRKYKNDKHIE